MNNMLSIVIPSRNDPCLLKTVNDILENAEGNIEIIVVLEGYWEKITNPKVTLIHHGAAIGMRDSINQAVAISHGKYILKCDSHCRFDKGFDTKLLQHIEDDWIVIPRRYKLDIDKWEICEDDNEPIDYEKLILSKNRIYGQRWPSRQKHNKHIMLDETMLFQGSCWVMSRTHWNKLGGLQAKGYGQFVCEPQELALKTWLGGGKVMTNKNTWYAHQHRKFKRTWHQNQPEIEAGSQYCAEYWLNNKWEDRIHDLSWLLERFGLDGNPEITTEFNWHK